MTIERHLQPGRDRPQGDKHLVGSQTAPLTRQERELVDACQQGKPLVCSELTPAELAGSEDPAHRISGEVIRDLLLGRHGDLDPRGLLLVSARITGQPNLDNVTTEVDLALVGCYLDAPVRANTAHLRGLSLSSSHLPALLADGLQVDSGVLLDEGFTAAGAGESGAVRLLRAHITGGLTCRASCSAGAWPAWPGGYGHGAQALLACALGDLHDLPLLAFRIVLHRTGWRVRYLGADTPLPHLTRMAADCRTRRRRPPAHRRSHHRGQADAATAQVWPHRPPAPGR